MMRGNGRVFVSHSHEDNELCLPLIDALHNWDVDYWFDTERLEAGQDLSDRIQSAIAERDTFIRVGTAAVLRRPYWVNLETNAFRALLADDENAGRHGKRVLITLVMDTSYVLQPFEKAHLYIDAARQPQEAWFRALRKALIPGRRSEPVQPDGTSQTVIVDWQGGGHYSSLSRAVKAAEDGQLIVVKPGVYQEHLVLDKRLTILGDGDLGSVVIEAESADVVLSSAISATLSNLVLRQMGGRGSWYGIDVRHGHLEIRTCDISSQSLACVAIHGSADVAITQCHIHSGKQSGLVVYDGAKGLIEDNEINDNSLHGLAVLTGGQPTVRNNRILRNAENGVFVHNYGRGIYEQNMIRANQHSGVAVSSGGMAVLRGNQINENAQFGVYVYDTGGGVVEGNDLKGNGQGPISILDESMARVTANNNIG